MATDGIILKGKVEGFNKVQRELKQTGKATKKMGRDMKGATGAGAGMGSMMSSLPALMNPYVLAAAAAAAALAALTAGTVGLAMASKKYIAEAFKLSEELDKLAKKSKNLGESGEEMQVIIGALELAGVGAEASMKAFTKLGKILGDEMVKGPGAAKYELAKLGLTAEGLDKMKLGDRMLAIADGMEGIESQSQRNSVAVALFGKAGADMLEAFRDRDALVAAIEDMERFGFASNESLRDSEALQDAVLRQKKAWQRMKREALTPLIPTLTGITNGLAEIMLGVKTDDITNFGKAFADAMMSAVKWVAALGHAMEVWYLQSRITWKMAAAVAYVGAGKLVDAALMAKDGLQNSLDLKKDMASAKARWVGWGTTVNDEIRKARSAAAIPWRPADEVTGGPDGDDDDDGKPAKRRKRAKDLLQIQLERLAKENAAFRESEKTKTQILDEAVAAREATITAALERGAKKGGMTEQEAVRARKNVWDWEASERAKITAARVENERRAADEEIKIAEAASAKILEQAKTLAANEETQRQGTIAATVAGIDAVGSFAAMISDTMAQTGADQTEEGKRAAKALFLVTQSAALASAIVNTAVAVSAGLANPPGPPYSIPQAVAAGIMGGVQIATIVGTTIGGLADAGLPPGALKKAGLTQHSLIAMRNDEMVLDPVGTAAISRMLEERQGGSGQPIEVRTTLELDGHVLGQVVDAHLVRSAERGNAYQSRIRYGAR